MLRTTTTTPTPTTTSSSWWCCSGTSMRTRLRLQAVGLCAALSLPSICVTLALHLSDKSSKLANGTITSRDMTMWNRSSVYPCYENYTTFYPRFVAARFWIEGVTLVSVGVLGLLGNLMTLVVLKKSKRSRFNHLLMFLSTTDTVLIVFFLLLSFSTVFLSKEPKWFVVMFPHILWPLGNIAITASVLTVVAVSTERYLAICRPLQYKPTPIFYVVLVLLTSLTVNTGRFLEYEIDEDGQGQLIYRQSRLMADAKYIVFSRYWTDLTAVGVLPLVALVGLNHGIYTKIRKSNRFRKMHDNRLQHKIANKKSIRARPNNQTTRSEPTGLIRATKENVGVESKQRQLEKKKMTTRVNREETREVDAPSIVVHLHHDENEGNINEGNNDEGNINDEGNNISNINGGKKSNEEGRVAHGRRPGSKSGEMGRLLQREPTKLLGVAATKHHRYLPTIDKDNKDNMVV